MKNQLYPIAYKPFNVLTQFSGEKPDETLQMLQYDFPKDVYPVGRLDKDSEGLLLLTNNKRLNHRLLAPKFKHEKEYWAQVEKAPTPAALEQLSKGLTLNDCPTLPAKAKRLEAEPELPLRNPPLRYRAAIPTAWISLILTEGRNRQVRRMTAAVGFPTLRLVRWRLENLILGGLQPGQVRELTKDERTELFRRMKLK